MFVISIKWPDGILGVKCTLTSSEPRLWVTVWINVAMNALEALCTWFWINYWLLRIPKPFMLANFSRHSPSIQLPCVVNNTVCEVGILRKGRGHTKRKQTTDLFAWCFIKTTRDYESEWSNMHGFSKRIPLREICCELLQKVEKSHFLVWVFCGAWL